MQIQPYRRRQHALVNYVAPPIAGALASQILPRVVSSVARLWAENPPPRRIVIPRQTLKPVETSRNPPKPANQKPPKHEETKTVSKTFTGATIVGNSTGASYHRIRGNPQVLTDQTGNSNFTGIRVEFSDIMPNTLGILSTVAPSNLIPAFLLPAGGLGYGANITPAGVSRRLAQLSAMYEFYAFREITFEFIPAKSTAQDGQIAFGVMRDPAVFSDGEFNNVYGYQNIMELETAISTSVWSTARVTMRFKGTKVWYTMNNPSGVSQHSFDDYVQSMLVAGTAGVPVPAAVPGTEVLGHFRVSGIIDLYRTVFIERGSVNVLLNESLLKKYLETYIQSKDRISFREWLKTPQASAEREGFRRKAILALADGDEKWEKC